MTSPIFITWRERVRSSILIKCLPPYIMEWIGLLMNEYYNRHNRLASACPLTNLSPVFGPSMKRKIGIREAIT